MKFRNLKKTTSATDPVIVVVLPISQVPPQIVDPIMELAGVIMVVDLSSLDAPLLGKCKGKELSVQNKIRETSSSAASELWKLEFFACEIDR